MKKIIIVNAFIYTMNVTENHFDDDCKAAYDIGRALIAQAVSE